uniref:39S ribosomal protein L46, mitochondrial n=1 Tax=Meloidogyne hapla TaxID=6305 RepID=A0A1I8AYF6_MELHA
MKLIQQQMYLLRLLGFDSSNMLQNIEQKSIIEKQVKPYLPLQNYTGPQQADRIVFLVKRRDINPDIIPHAPEVAPSEVKKFLLQYHSNPSLWFLGQKWVDFWYDVMENTNQNNSTKRNRAFIAADHSVLDRVINEAKSKWGNKYEIYHGNHILQEVKSPIQNGFIRGKNLRLNTEGRFPMYLLKEHSKFQNFKALNKITK